MFGALQTRELASAEKKRERLIGVSWITGKTDKKSLDKSW
jgi:hypothetical protein